MQLILQPDGSHETHINHIYRRAFTRATELYIVVAYLRSWDAKLKLNKGCKRFRFVVGKDFGITRINACLLVMQWFKEHGLSQLHFRVAHTIDGFHPKALFWRERDGKTYALAGSSNLSEAARSTNYEVNIFNEISSADFQRARTYVDSLKSRSLAVSEDWLQNKYVEAQAPKGGGKRGRNTSQGESPDDFEFPLPKISKSEAAPYLEFRRKQQKMFARSGCRQLINLMRRRAANEIKDSAFYEGLTECWQAGSTQWQSSTWRIKGKASKFSVFAKGFLQVYDAEPKERDDVVRNVLDKFAAQNLPIRRSVFTELLCQYFPDDYPVLNKPVETWVRTSAYRPARGMSEGECYIDIAEKLRHALGQRANYPATNLAELDALIWARSL